MQFKADFYTEGQDQKKKKNIACIYTMTLVLAAEKNWQDPMDVVGNTQ